MLSNCQALADGTSIVPQNAAASLGGLYESPANAYASVKALSGGLVEPTFEDSGDEVRVRGPGSRSVM